MNESIPTVIVVTDRALLVAAIERMVSDEYECESLTREDLEYARHQQYPGVVPVAVVIDLQTGLHQAIRSIQSQFPGVPTIVWQRSTAAEPSLNALDWGARGVLSDLATQAEIEDCLRAIIKGDAWVPYSVSQAFLRTTRCQLSPREGQLLRLVSRGLRNKEIAHTLQITEGTVKVYFSRLFTKLGVGDRYELALLALRHFEHESASGGMRDQGGEQTLKAVYISKSHQLPSAAVHPGVMAAAPPARRLYV